MSDKQENLTPGEILSTHVDRHNRNYQQFQQLCIKENS